MKEVKIEKALTFIEPGPVVLVTTFDGKSNNVMTISWTMAMDFAQHIAICTGEWNHSFGTMMRTKECVVCIPPAGMVETVVKIGMVSGADTDKFAKFGLEALPAGTVQAPLIAGCLACLECKVVDYVDKYGFVILHVTRVWENPDSKDRKMLHAKGDGRFVADGEVFDCRNLMEAKLPPGL